MAITWKEIVARADRWVPEGSPRKKLLQILAVILVFEGLSVLIFFSYQGAIVGIISAAIGVVLILLLRPYIETSKGPVADRTPGIRLVEYFIQLLGGNYVLVALGIMMIVTVLAYNAYLSPRPGLGDIDTLSIMFGGMLVLYPFAARKARTEASFALLFIALVVIFLVVPQAVTSVSESDSSSSIGNLYVHYMLAAPFAGILDLIGIPASSSGSSVTLEFHDGTVHTLGISAYCAGLYSFSIFLAAFFSFVLVFERLSKRLLILVLSVGLVVAYLGNLIRMVLIGVIGYYRGIDALLWAHENVGWIIFLSWSAVFWYLLLGFVSKESSNETSNHSAT